MASDYGFGSLADGCTVVVLRMQTTTTTLYFDAYEMVDESAALGGNFNLAARA